MVYILERIEHEMDGMLYEILININNDENYDSENLNQLRYDFNMLSTWR